MKIHDDDDISTLSLCKMCPFSELSFRMRENTDQNNSKYGHFLRSIWVYLEPENPKILHMTLIWFLLISINPFMYYVEQWSQIL